MTLQSSGAISLNDIQNEFGGANPIGMNEYYAGGSYVPSGTGSIPSSGTINFAQFYSTQKRFTLNYTVNGATANMNMWNLAVSYGWNQSTPITINLTNASFIYGSDTGQWALHAGGSSWPSTSVLNLTNNGGCYIVGAGGNGGNGSQYTVTQATNGGGGGHAILCNGNLHVNLWNNGGIYGGGGGGGGSASYDFDTYITTGGYCSGYWATYTADGFGGGGGGGYVGGAGGWSNAGAGGWNYGGAGGGGKGGGGGSVGNSGGAATEGRPHPGYSNGSGGSSGYYIYGWGNVSAYTTGSVAGLLA